MKAGVILYKKITAREYQREMEKIKELNKQRLYKLSLEKERGKYKRKYKLETSKLIAFYLFALLNAIVIYAMVAMWKFADFTYLGVLISDIAAQVLIYAIYCLKAYKAKKSEEEMKLRNKKLDSTFEEVLEAGANSNETVPTRTGSVETFQSEGCG